MAKLAYYDKQISALIAGIEDGSITELNLPQGYYNAVADYMSRAVMEGFGATLETVAAVDEVVLKELLTNMYMFSGGKTFQIVKEISSLLVDENGKVRSSRDFNKLGRETYDTWNDNWGRTEYNTAIAQADMSAKWQEIERQADIFPNLRYSAIGDPCTICRPLDGMIAPVNSPIWSKVYPINHFNCQCVVLQEDGSAKITPMPETLVDPVVDRMKERKQDTFINNVGKTGQIFTKDHPYFDVAQEYKEYAKNNFNLPIPTL